MYASKSFLFQCVVDIFLTWWSQCCSTLFRHVVDIMATIANYRENSSFQRPLQVRNPGDISGAVFII